VIKRTGDPLVADVATLRVGPFALMPPFVIVKLGQSLYGNEFHVAQVWVDNPPVALIIDNTRGLPVSLALLPAGFHVARVNSPRLSMVSPPNPAHQSPTAGSVCLTTGNDETDAAEMARLNNGARSRVNMSKDL